MYAYKIKPNPSVIIFPKSRGKYCATEINKKDLWIKTFWICRGSVKITYKSTEDKLYACDFNLLIILSFFLFDSNNFQFLNMCSCKRTLTFISLFWKNLNGIFLQEIFTSKDFEVAILFWKTKFERDHHKSHTNLQRINSRYITSFYMHYLGSLCFLVSLGFPLKRTFFFF